MKMDSEKSSLLKETVSLAWPSVLEQVFTVLTTMVGTFMVSSLGHVSVAATGLTLQPKFFLMAPLFALNVATGAIIARKHGEENQDGAISASKLIILISTVYSILIGVLCFFLAHPMMILCGGNEETTDIATTYFKITMAGLVFTSFTLIFGAIQRSMKHPGIAMIANIISMIVNIFFNYTLIYGHFGFPKMGIVGSAIATVLGTAVSTIILFVSLLNKKLYVNFVIMVKNKVHIDKATVKSVTLLSANFMSEDVIKRLSFLLIGIIAAKTGTKAFAAHQVGMSLLNLAFAFGMGMQTASVTLTGNALGKKNIQLARKYTRNCLTSGLALGCILSVFILIFGTKFFGIYFSDMSIIEIGHIINFYIAAIVPIQICQVIYSGSLRASGDVKYTLIASTLTIAFGNLLVDFVLVILFKLGIQGVWVGTLFAQTALLVAHFFRYRGHRWENKKI